MSIAIKGTACALVIAAAAPFAQAEVLNFDDLTGLQFFATDYHGFLFGPPDQSATAWFHTDQANPPVGPHSGSVYLATDFRLYGGTDLEATQAITSSVPFEFDGAWFSGTGPVAYKLYSGGQLVYSSAASTPLGATPQFVASGYAQQVDSVVVLGRQGYYGMDDFTFNAGTVVPEPATHALLAAGGLVLLAAARSRRAG